MYAIHPGYIFSAYDGDRHYIGYGQLIRLYNLNPKECILWDDERPETFAGRKKEDYHHLYPSRMGNYTRRNK